jgi:hypothetical protein
MSRRAGRRIVVAGVAYRWTQRHGHVGGKCTETFAAFPEAGPGRMEVRLCDGQGVDAQGGWPSHSGGFRIDGVSYSLHMPSLAAALIRGALSSGWDPGSATIFRPADPVEFVRQHGRSAS